MEDKPYSQASENNKEPILRVIQPLFENVASVLEVGSGTGQHAVHFASHMPHLTWHTSDLSENHPGINAWIKQANVNNLRPPKVFDVNEQWPQISVDAVFSANTLHIMSWQSVQRFFQGLASIVNPKALLVIYGPFNYGGNFTSPSNARFEQWLKEVDPQRGIRDFEAVNQLAQDAGLSLLADHEMPANNRLLVWQMN